jgi:glycosyltransferase involved in cell wall biosynthesis
MKIGIVAPIWYPIPPLGYGGIELVVSLLTEELVDRGNEVTLFASGDSNTKAELVPTFPQAPSEKIGQVYPDLMHALTAYLYEKNFDVIHDHSGMIGPTLGYFSSQPILHTLHGPATEESKRLYRLLSPRVYFNSISKYQQKCYGDLNWAANVYNAIDLRNYPYSATKEDYLLFLGRMSAEKGVHLAVEIANRLNQELIMVTKMVEPKEKQYFEEKVKPLIKSNTHLIGQIDIATKAELFRKAKCTLFPIQWPEPFGLVMIESMATGTPVVAMGKGAVPEVIIDKQTGFIVNNLEEMVEAIGKVNQINPANCRKYVEENFSTKNMVDAYERAYRYILERENKSERIA